MLAQVDFPGPEGFLGTRGSLMLDFVVVAMFGVLAVMAWSIWQVKKGRFFVHKWTQIILATVLLIAVIAFEVEIQTFGWEHRASGVIDGKASALVWNSLYVHLCFAIPSVLLWPIVVIRAVRQFPTPPAPSEHSKSHLLWARAAAVAMTGTAITGWFFYYLGFVK